MRCFLCKRVSASFFNLGGALNLCAECSTKPEAARACKQCGHVAITHDRQTCSSCGNCTHVFSSGTCQCRMGWCSCEHPQFRHNSDECLETGCDCSLMTLKKKQDPLLQEINSYLSSFDSPDPYNRWNKMFFSGEGPGGILQTEKALTEEQYVRVKVEWDRRHQTVKRADRISILEAWREET